MSYSLVVNNQNVVGSGNNTYQYNFLKGNFLIPEGTEMLVANVQIPYSFYNITSAYGNNVLYFYFPTGTASYASYTITIPDGFYTTTSLSNYLQMWMISNGFYLYNSTTAQNVYYITLVYNSYQYGNQILVSTVPSALPSGYSLPSGYTSSTIFGGWGFPFTSTRTPFVAFPITSSTNNTIGTFLGFGSSNATATVPLLTAQPISTIAGGASITVSNATTITANVGSGATFTYIFTGGVITGVTITNGGTNYYSPVLTLSGGGASAQASINITTTNGVITGYSIVSGGTGYSSQPTSSITTGLYSLTITQNGSSNYYNPTITLSGGGGTTQATVTLITTNGAITGYNITNYGAGYTSTPTVSAITFGIYSLNIVNGGSNYATAYAVFSGSGGTTATLTTSKGVITGYTITNNGSMTTAPSVIVSPQPLMANISAGAVSGIIILNGGYYTSTPTLAFIGGGSGAFGAAATVTLTGTAITSVTITSGGIGYTSTPTVIIITNNNGSITATQTGGSIFQTGITIVNGGSGYVNPTITFSGGGATTQATGTLTVTNGVITGVYITNPGAGYTSNPTVTINPNGGSYSGNSTATPVGSTVNSIIMRCSIVKNNVTNPNDILDSFPITAGTAFGTNINYTPNIEKWVKVANGSFSNFIINFCDQNLNQIAALDPNILITLLLRFPKNYVPPSDYGGPRRII